MSYFVNITVLLLANLIFVAEGTPTLTSDTCITIAIISYLDIHSVAGENI